MPNQNANDYLEKIKAKLFENLRMLPHAPSVQMQTVPDDAMNVDEAEAEASDAQEDTQSDKRSTERMKDKRIANDNDYSDSEDEDDRKHTENYKQNMTANKKRLHESKNGQPSFAIAVNDTKPDSVVKTDSNAETPSVKKEYDEKMIQMETMTIETTDTISTAPIHADSTDTNGETKPELASESC